MIEYRSLDFLGYSQYKVDNLGNVYRFKFWKSGLNEKQYWSIKKIYKITKTTQIKLSKQFDVSKSTIKNIISYNKDIWIKMKPGLGTNGRYHIILYKNHVPNQWDIARLILTVFVGPCPENMECCHNNGIKTDNNLVNLRWGTKKENTKDKILHNTYQYGEKNHRSKLQNEDILVIRYLDKFCSQIEIGKLYNVKPATICLIIKRKLWKHI